MKKKLTMMLAVFGMVAALSCAIFISACASQSVDSDGTAAQNAEATEEATAEAEGADAGSIDVGAEQWQSMFPDQYQSWVDAGEVEYSKDTDRGKINALADLPDLHEKGEGVYVGDNMYNWEPWCLECHTANWNNLKAKYGMDLLDQDMDAVYAEAECGITCYSCHGDTPGQPVIVNSVVADGLEQGGWETSEWNKVCAQCHSLRDRWNIVNGEDYENWSYLVAGTDPDDLWDYVQEKDGVAPVVSTTYFESFYGSTMEQAGAECIDCHMPVDSETGMRLHQFQGVTQNQDLYENCLRCHTDSTVEERAKALAQVQADWTVESEAAQAQIDQLTADLEAATEAGEIDADTLAEVQTLLDKAIFYNKYATFDGSCGIHSMGSSGCGTCFERIAATVEEAEALLA